VILIKSGEGSAPPTAPFSDKEISNFEMAYRAIMKRYNYNSGARDIFDNPEVKEGILELAKAYKYKKGLTFDGLVPEAGFGMQPIHQFDVIGTNISTPGAGLDNWYVSWTAGSSNIFNAWLYDKAEAIGTTAFGGANVNDIVPRDSNNDEWATAVIGFEQLSATSVVKSIRWTQNRETVGDFDVESQFMNSEMGIADIGMILWQPPGKPFAAGTHTIAIGTDAVKVLGVTFGTATRFRQKNAGYRNRCQSG